MKDKIIQTTLELIDREKSARSVGLREIARSVGCSAPNIYNYFKNLNGLLNMVMQYIIDDYQKTMSVVAGGKSRKDSLLMRAVDAMVSYALRHEGWLYFFHFEKIDMRITADTERKRRDTGNFMAGLLRMHSGDRLTRQESMHVSGLIHHYILGELSQFLTNRKPVKDKAALKQKIIRNSEEIYSMCLRRHGSDV